VSARNASKPSAKQAILDAFERSVAERGYSDTALSEVAAEVGVSKGTIVHHFLSKERILAALHVEYMRRRMHEVRYIKSVLDGPVDQLVAITYAILASHRDEYTCTRCFMREITLFSSSPNMADVREIRRDYQASVSEVIERGMKEGAIQQADVSLVTMQIFAMVNHTWTWYRPDGYFSMAEIASSYVTVLLGGLLPQDSEAELPAKVADLIERSVAVIEDAHQAPSARDMFSPDKLTPSPT
jgi:AcrR family transcriptional regulator